MLSSFWQKYTLQGTNPAWDKKNHLHKGLRRGYVSSQEGIWATWFVVHFESHSPPLHVCWDHFLRCEEIKPVDAGAHFRYMTMVQ